MRIQVAIHRHSLPAVHLIFNTTSVLTNTGTRILSVSDFLSALHTIIPLESSDGEWGLEDYTVLVAATSDQDHQYECLHYQNVKDVFREDDEVVVRGLTSEELRERRLGGRTQITGDGRRLLDGVAWGKTFRGGSAVGFRPDVIIPPRKRRRILYEEEEMEALEDNLSGQLPELRYPGELKQVGKFIDTDEDDEDEADDDYLGGGSDEGTESFEEGAEDSDESEEDESQQEGEPRSAFVTAKFYDEDEAHPSDADKETDNEINGELDRDEIQMLLKEASELEKLSRDDSVISAQQNKRKRSQGDRSIDEIFEGFPSSQTNKKADPVKIGPYTVDKVNGHVQSGSSSENESGSNSDSNSSSESESEGSSESEQDSEQSGSDEDTSSESDSDFTSDSDDSDSDSSSEASPEGSENKAEAGKVSAVDIEKGALPQGNGLSSEKTPKEKLSSDKPPGTGSARTKKNNDRAKRRKRLNALKQANSLPLGADFNDLRAYDAQQGSTEAKVDDSFNVPDEMTERAAGLEEKRKELLARINGSLEEDVEEIPSSQPDFVEDTHHDQLAQDKAEEQNVAESLTSQTPLEPSTGEPRGNEKEEFLGDKTPPQRARLDIASTRRMLFGSLGLKNPKTKAAEDALREKLTQSAREIEKRHQKRQEETRETADLEADTSWKSKLMISAVECVQEGMLLKPPPFPFQQNWDKYVTHDGYETMYDENQVGALNYDDQSIQQADESGIKADADIHGDENAVAQPTPSKTLSISATNHDDLPYVTDIDALPDLTPQDLVEGAVITYKELYINARFEPEESSYRTAQIADAQEDFIQVLLSKRDLRELSGSGSYDEMGQRIYHGLELPDGDDQIDDGRRELSFSSLIGPKLVKPGNVQVPATASDESEESKRQENPEVVPESTRQLVSQPSVNVEQIEVNTPRRAEITTMIKDAGFNSVLDDQLLQPISSVQANSAGQSQRSSGRSSRENSLHLGNSALDTPVADDVWNSSSIDQGDSALRSTSPLTDLLISPANENSPPTVSLVETVDYPHVSRIHLNTSSLSSHIASSSYQDAQRTSQDISEGIGLHSQYDNAKNDTLVTAQSLVSGVSQTQFSTDRSSSPANGMDSLLDIGIDVRRGSVPARSDRYGNGLETAGAEPDLEEIEEGEEIDSDGLPSLRALTSSQKYRAASQAVSPPPLRKISTNSRMNKQGAGQEKGERQPVMSPKVTAENEENMLSSSSSGSNNNNNKKSRKKPDIKLSQPDEQISLSQVPQEKEARVIDLTLSSDPAGPDSSQENANHDRNQDKNELLPRRTSPRNRSGKKSNVEVNDQAAKMMRSALAGLGGRRNLGKKRSFV